MKNMIITTFLTLATTNLFPLHASSLHPTDLSPINTYLGDEAARVSTDYLNSLNPCLAYPEDYECVEAFGSSDITKDQAIDELATRLNQTLWNKFLPGLEAPEARSAVHGAIAEGVYEIAHAAAEMAVEVYEDQKRLEEMKKRQIEQANEAGYGHILVRTLHEQGL